MCPWILFSDDDGDDVVYLFDESFRLGGEKHRPKTDP